MDFQEISKNLNDFVLRTSVVMYCLLDNGMMNDNFHREKVVVFVSLL